jgi:glycosyltransferase involved in cell wall biosynthesis
LDSAILWLGERSEIAPLLRCFDLFVQTSIFEGMSNTILEAMATGLPIIATDTGGNPELVSNGENGTLINVGDTAQLSAALRTLIEDKALRFRYGTASRNRATDQFDLSLMAARYSDLYESLM